MEATKQIVYLESMISSLVSSSPYSPLLRELRAFASCLRRRRCLVISILLLFSRTKFRTDPMMLSVNSSKNVIIAVPNCVYFDL